jgi:hypothetical protein
MSTIVKGNKVSSTGQVDIIGGDGASGTVYITDASPAKSSYIKQTGITQLTAAGNTVATNVSNYDIIGYSFTVASINTNVVVQIEATIDDSNWFTAPLRNTSVADMSIANQQATVSANGTYFLTLDNVKASQVRFDFVSETGGTAATIDADLMVGN